MKPFYLITEREHRRRFRTGENIPLVLRNGNNVRAIKNDLGFFKQKPNIRCCLFENLPSPVVVCS